MKTKYIEKFNSLTAQEKADMITNFSDGRIYHNLFQQLADEQELFPLESELRDIIHNVLDNINLKEWAKWYLQGSKLEEQ